MAKTMKFPQRTAIAIVVVVMVFVTGIGLFCYKGMYEVTYQNMHDTLGLRANTLQSGYRTESTASMTILRIWPPTL